MGIDDSMGMLVCNMAETLLRYGASVHNPGYPSPIHLAMEKRQKSLACILLRHGATASENPSDWESLGFTDEDLEWRHLIREFYVDKSSNTQDRCKGGYRSVLLSFARSLL